MYSDDDLTQLHDYPEVLISGVSNKRKFWERLSPWNTGALGESAPAPIPAGRVELPVRVDPDLVPAPEFDVLLKTRRELSEEEVTDAMAEAMERMEDVYPQFFLRNIGRAVREADDVEAREDLELGLIPIREGSLEAGREALRTSQAAQFSEKGVSARFYEVVEETRYLLFAENWGRLFGRESKETIPVAPWAHFPTRSDLERYGESGYREFVAEEAAAESEETIPGDS